MAESAATHGRPPVFAAVRRPHLLINNGSGLEDERRPKTATVHVESATHPTIFGGLQNYSVRPQFFSLANDVAHRLENPIPSSRTYSRHEHPFCRAICNLSGANSVCLPPRISYALCTPPSSAR